MFWSTIKNDEKRRKKKISIMRKSDISSLIQNVSGDDLECLHSLNFHCLKPKGRKANREANKEANKETNKEANKDIFECPITIHSQNKKMLYVFLWLHSGFQQLRHNYNHAGNTPNGISVVQISQSIKNYVHLANELLIHPGRESKTP